jgi:large subunit ribosomal protein L25
MSQSSDIVITVAQRENVGRRGSAHLRRQGQIPAVVYGGDKPPYPITVDEKTIKELLKSEHGTHSIFLLKLEGSKDERRAMIKEIQADPVTGQFLHIDFIRVVKGHALQVEMPIELVGDSYGVRHGGRLDFVTRSVRIELLPKDMFDKLTADITELDVGDNITVADLASQLPESAKFLEEPQRVVVLVEAPRKVEEPTVEAKEELELVAEESAEPEVIKRGKEDDQESAE